jgi:hypothetical protein
MATAAAQAHTWHVTSAGVHALQILFVNLVRTPTGDAARGGPGQPGRDAPAAAARPRAHPDPPPPDPDPAGQRGHGGRHPGGADYAPGPEPQLGVRTVAGTMAFVTFVFFQAFNLLNVRNDRCSGFSRETLENRSAFVATVAVIVLLVFIVEMDVLHGFMTTTDLTSGQWLTCAAIGSAVLWVGELGKIVIWTRADRACSR